MYLKRIDMHGFKSFADNISIDIAEGITAIVGPNGSGKSNISDAVRWVLGEQSAKALRGSKMEDVIFDGAEKRKPLSFCEVSLTFNNEDGFLALPHNEVSISRRVYRSGESEYLINSSACRMKDINSLFYDTGVGRVGYSIIGQGRIEEILSPKGDERRAAFEEAAGVMKYKVRREEAQRKLNNVGKDMQRIDDIVGELELSLEPLRLQSEQAREYMAIKQELKDLEVNLFLNRYKANEDKRNRLDRQERELGVQEKADSDKDAGIRHEQSILSEKMDLTRQLLARAREKELEYSSGAQRLTGEVELLKQKEQYLKAELSRLASEQATARQSVDEIKRTLENSETTGDDIIQLREKRLAELEQAAAQTQKQAEQTEYELDGLKQKLMNIMDDSGEKKARQARMEALGEQARQKLEEIKESARMVQQEYEQLSQEAMAAKKEADELYIQRDDTAYTAIAAEEQGAGLLQQLEACQQAAREAEREAQNSAQTLKIQTQLKQDLEGYANSVRSLMRGLAGQDDGVYGVVGNLLKVPKKYEKAMELTLGGGLQNVVVRDEQVAKRLIAYLRKNDFGRVTFLPVESLRPRTFSSGEEAQLSGRGVLGVASQLVEYSRDIRPAVEYLLGRTVIVEDMDSGIAISRKLSFSFRCVTLQGDIINAGGPITGGSNRERGLVSRDRLIEDARGNMERAAELFKQQTAQAESIKARLEAKNAEAQALRKDVYSIEAKIAAIEERLDATLYQKQRAEESLAKHNEDITRTESAILAAQESGKQTEQSNGDDEEQLRMEIETVGRLLSEQRSRRDEAIEAFNKERVEFASFHSEVVADQKNRERLERELRQLTEDIQAKGRNIAGNESELLKLEQKKEQTRTQYETMQQQNGENDIALNKLDDEIVRQEKQMNDLTAEREGLQECIKESVKKRYDIKAQMERLLAEFEGMQNRIWEEYSLSYATAKELEREIKVGEATAKIEELRTRLRGMDNVNPGAVEEYERVSTRYEFLTTQREDLSKAKEDLGRLIDELTKEMESKFLDQFYRINDCFSKVFKSLFGGGKAELVLQDKDNAMESQIEIIAQPPGKKLQLLSLLSGGERALTAIAILFAMLELKATPFCILDEIEAALDEENLRLFADYLKDYSKKTQFIIITHRRPTMEAASTMYGIAMEEKGVSKLVSVKFADAV